MVRKCYELEIPAKRSKIVGPESERTIILGIEFNRGSVLRPDAEKLKTILAFTRQYSVACVGNRAICRVRSIARI